MNERTTPEQRPVMPPEPADGSAASDPRVNLFDYLGVLSRNRRFLIVFVVAATLLVAVYLMVMPQTYVATVVLLPPDKSEGVSLSSLVQSSRKLDFAGLSENSSAETLAKMIASRTVADSLVRRFDLLKVYQIEPSLRALAIEKALSHMDVTSDRQGFITVSFSVQTPWMASSEDQEGARKLSAAIANAAVEVLDRLNRQKNISRARRSREFLDVMRHRKRAELDSFQLRMEEFQRRNKSFAIDDQAQVSLEALIALQAEINKIEIQIAGAEVEYVQGPILERLRAQLSQLKRRKTELEAGNIGDTKTSFPLSAVPELARQYLTLKLDLEVTTQIYTFLEAEYHQQAVQEARDLPTITILDSATPYPFRSAPRRTLMLTLAFTIIVIVGVVLVFIGEGITRQWAARRTERLAASRSTPGSGD